MKLSRSSQTQICCITRIAISLLAFNFQVMNSLKYVIREARPTDFPFVQSLVYLAHVKALLPSGTDCTPFLHRIFPTLHTIEEFSLPTSHYWVASTVDCTNEVIGAISIIEGESGETSRSSCVELNAFYVSESYQRKGIGSALMKEALQFCRSSGVRRVDLTSNKGYYDPAIRYYEKIGFSHVKEYEIMPGVILVDLKLDIT